MTANLGAAQANAVSNTTFTGINEDGIYHKNENDIAVQQRILPRLQGLEPGQSFEWSVESRGFWCTRTYTVL